MAEKKDKGFARVFSAQPALPKAHLVSVEADVGKGLHAFSVVGLPDKAVEEARDRISSAIKNSGDLKAPKSQSKKIVISLAPAALKKEGAVFDLPMALSYLLAADEISFDPKGKLFAGELSLDGRLRPIAGVLSLVLMARERGFREAFVPEPNVKEAALVSGISVYGVRTLADVIAHLNTKEARSNAADATQLTPQPPTQFKQSAEPSDVLSSIRGQAHAKRALEIAAAGRHNISLYGPPGTGKTMLARALTALLPALTSDEIIEVTAIHSYAGALSGSVVLEAPFRSPHHSSSHVALVGGGTVPRPGEVTLAHRGVLFLDEFPEFPRDCINALRQPLEDKVVTVSRAKGSYLFPANVLLVAALNPCPCGNFGTSKCTCPAHAIERYRRKISGPIADRIDMWVHIGEVPPEALGKREKQAGNETRQALSRVAHAQQVQANRFSNQTDMRTNADLGAKKIEELANLSKDAEQVLTEAARSLGLSARAYHRTIKLARTIADLAGSEHIAQPHMLEALQYRKREW